jgi:hypothetical protein
MSIIVVYLRVLDQLNSGFCMKLLVPELLHAIPVPEKKINHSCNILVKAYKKLL